jgi:hypothetical protein
MENISKTEYLHKSTQTVWQHAEEYPNDTEEYYCFQNTEKPEALGFIYVREYKTEPKTDTE